MKKIAIIAIVCALFCLTACGTTATNSSGITEPGDIYLVLVNKTHPIPDNWEDNIELVTSYDPWGDEVQIESVTFDHFSALQEVLLSQGIDIRLDSVYRSVDDQITLWDYFAEQYGEDYCKEYVAAPGCSEHHTGLAVDICIVKDGEIINDNDQMLAEEDTFATIHTLMSDYGFILRYPPGKEDITGYSYEPWHLRYVGTFPAQEIAMRGITLEEYLDEY